MKAIKIIVDTIPKTCKECMFVRYEYSESQSVDCIAIDGESSTVYGCKHKNCPLQQQVNFSDMVKGV